MLAQVRITVAERICRFTLTQTSIHQRGIGKGSGACADDAPRTNLLLTHHNAVSKVRIYSKQGRNKNNPQESSAIMTRQLRIVAEINDASDFHSSSGSVHLQTRALSCTDQ